MSGHDNEEETLQYNMTVPRELAEALAEHYHDDPEVRNVPDAFRTAGRGVIEGRGD